MTIYANRYEIRLPTCTHKARTVSRARQADWLGREMFCVVLFPVSCFRFDFFVGVSPLLGTSFVRLCLAFFFSLALSRICFGAGRRCRFQFGFFFATVVDVVAWNDKTFCFYFALFCRWAAAKVEKNHVSSVQSGRVVHGEGKKYVKNIVRRATVPPSTKNEHRWKAHSCGNSPCGYRQSSGKKNVFELL